MALAITSVIQAGLKVELDLFGKKYWHYLPSLKAKREVDPGLALNKLSAPPFVVSCCLQLGLVLLFNIYG